MLKPTPLATPPHKQLKPKVSRRGRLNPLICKLCGISFFYRRCLFRHLRENHAQIVDVNNLPEYIETNTQNNNSSNDTFEGVSTSPPTQPSGLDVTVGSELENSIEYNLQSVSTSDQPSISDSPAELSQPELTQPNSSVAASVATSIIEAVQNQAILEQASVLLSQNSIENQSSEPPPSSSSLLSHINSVSMSNSPNTSTTKNQTSARSEEGTTNFREFKCTICNKAFDRPYRLTRHLEIHDPNRPRIPCNYCSKTFTRKDSLESHIKTVHASVHPFTCNHDGCSRSFATRSMYLNHLKVHGDNKPYHCQECSECFTLLSELKEHFKKEHPENESLRCNECFKVWLSLEELEEHKLQDHRFECESCGKIFARLAYLQVHVRVHNGEAKFNCRFCSEGFNSAYSYRQHMKNHPEYRRIVNVFPCHPCNKTFQDPSDLVAHYQTSEHREKAASVETAVGPSTATSMMEGDLSVMSDLMTHVVMNESDEIINSIVNTHTSFDEITTSQS